MANSITSLRTIARHGLEDVRRGQSVLEAALRHDPAGVYPRMTFATRDQYRHVVERIAKRTGSARRPPSRATAVAPRRRRRGESRGARHVGYYLVDEGLPRRWSGDRLPAAGSALRLHRVGHRATPTCVFGGGVLVGTLVALAALLWLAGPAARRGLAAGAAARAAPGATTSPSAR